MAPTLILDSSVLIAGLRSSIGASFALLDLVGSDRFTIGLSAALVLEAAIASGSEWIVTHNIRDMAAGAARYGIDVIKPGEALRRLGVEQ